MHRYSKERMTMRINGMISAASTVKAALLRLFLRIFHLISAGANIIFVETA
jgi:hypothetical protein